MFMLGIIIMMLAFAVSYEGLSIGIRYSGGKIRIFNVFLTKFEVWNAWATEHLYEVLMLSILLFGIANGGGFVGLMVLGESIKLTNKKEVCMEEVKRSPLSILVDRHGGKLFLANIEDVSEEMVKLPARPSDAVQGRSLVIVGKPAAEVVTSVNKSISRIVGHKVDIRQLPGKRVKDLAVPEITVKGFNFKRHRLLKGESTKIKGIVIPKDLGVDGVGFISSHLAELLARTYAPTIEDIPEVLRRMKKHGVKLCGIGFKGVFYVLPESEVGSIKFLRMFISAEDTQEIISAINNGAEIILDKNTAKLIRKEEFSLTLGKTLLLHELGGFFRAGFSMSQAMSRWFMLPEVAGFNIEPAEGIINRYKERLQTAFDAINNPIKAADLIAEDADESAGNPDFLSLLEEILRGFGFASEIRGTLNRMLFSGLKIRSRKMVMGASEYLIPANGINAGNVDISVSIAKRLKVEEGDFVIVQKSPLLPGDTLILMAHINPYAVGVMVNPNDLPSGWDGDGDKAVVIKAADVFTNPMMAKVFFDMLRDEIHKIHEDIVKTETSSAETLADGKRWIATADAGFTRWVVHLLHKGKKVSPTTIAKAGAVLQVAIDFSNGKTPQNVDDWGSKVESLANFRGESGMMFSEHPFLGIILNRSWNIDEKFLERIKEDGISIPYPIDLFVNGIDVGKVEEKPFVSVLKVIKVENKGVLTNASFLNEIFRALANEFKDFVRKEETFNFKISAMRHLIRVLQIRAKALDDRFSEEAKFNFLFSKYRSDTSSKAEIRFINKHIRNIKKEAIRKHMDAEAVVNTLIPKAIRFYIRKSTMYTKRIRVAKDVYLKKRASAFAIIREHIKDADPAVVINSFRFGGPLTRWNHSFIDAIVGTATGKFVWDISRKLSIINEALENKWRVWELANQLNIDWHVLADHHFKVVDDEVARKARLLYIEEPASPNDNNDGNKGGNIMDNLTIKTGDIFTSNMRTLVNPVNCVGVMGKGLALEFKNRYPDMFEEYRNICKAGGLKPGKLHLWKGKDKWVLNFPTKIHWRNKSKLDWVEAGLKEFVATYKEKSIKGVAFPLLGAGNGGLDPVKVLQIMKKYLTGLDIPVEIYVNEEIKKKEDEIMKNEKQTTKKGRTIICAFDGSKNKNGVACGFVAGRTKKHFDLPDSYTHNQAEITGLYKLASFLWRNRDKLHEDDKVIIKSDSKLVVNQINGKWKVNDRQWQFVYAQIREVFYRIPPKDIKVIWVPREENKEADKIAKSRTGKTVCFTGHRPNKLGGYDENNPTIKWVKKELEVAIDKAIEAGFTTFISGGALGVDQWAAEIVIKKKEKHPNIKLVIAKPFPSQGRKWPASSRKRFHKICESVDTVVDISPDPYTREKMMRRNQWMIDKSDVVIAVWDGSTGGTADAVNKAIEAGKPIYRINPKTKEIDNKKRGHKMFDDVVNKTHNDCYDKYLVIMEDNDNGSKNLFLFDCHAYAEIHKVSQDNNMTVISIIYVQVDNFEDDINFLTYVAKKSLELNTCYATWENILEDCRNGRCKLPHKIPDISKFDNAVVVEVADPYDEGYLEIFKGTLEDNFGNIDDIKRKYRKSVFRIYEINKNNIHKRFDTIEDLVIPEDSDGKSYCGVVVYRKPEIIPPRGAQH